MLAHKRWCQAGRPRHKDNDLFKAHKLAEKELRSKLKMLEKEYEDEKILTASMSADCDKNYFWRLLKREKMGNKTNFTAIKNANSKAVYNLEQVLDLWADHFVLLSTPKQSTEYDEEVFKKVNSEVKELLLSDDPNEFSSDFFSTKEICECIKKLNANKSPWLDGITKEHLIPAGEMLPRLLMFGLKWIFLTEYVPTNFRTGVQVPLHKGKNTSILDINTFRGIMLLSTLNKIFAGCMQTRALLRTYYVANAGNYCRAVRKE